MVSSPEKSNAETLTIVYVKKPEMGSCQYLHCKKLNRRNNNDDDDDDDDIFYSDTISFEA